jgi:hypothetical protein
MSGSGKSKSGKSFLHVILESRHREGCSRMELVAVLYLIWTFKKNYLNMIVGAGPDSCENVVQLICR